MYKKTIVILTAIILLCGFATIFIVSRDEPTEKVPSVTVSVPVTTFVSADTNETISVRFMDTQAVLNGIGYKDVTFLPVEAASGAKYESKETNLTLWSKGNEVTLSRGRQTLFIGLDVDQDIFEENDWQEMSTDVTPDSAGQATTSEAEEVTQENVVASSSGAAVDQ